MILIVHRNIIVSCAAKLENMCVWSNASSITTFSSLAKPIFRKGHYARIFLLDLALVLGSFGIVCRFCVCRFVLCNFGIVWMRFVVPKVVHEDDQLWLHSSLTTAATSQSSRCVLVHIFSKQSWSWITIFHVRQMIGELQGYFIT